MSGGDQWAPGDLALCVLCGGSAKYAPGQMRIIKGGIYTVTGVHRDYLENLGLSFEGYRAANIYGAWRASAFRKIKPFTDEERRQELADLPVPERVPA